MSRFLWAAILCAATPALAGTMTFESQETPATLIELFTSEGCSSCPPADTWMSSLKSRPDLWKRIVPVVFHVDYWNYLGWSDRFATAANTARQRRYVAAWRGDSVYTPGFVLNGREWRGWSGAASVPEPSSTKVGKLTATIGDGRANVIFVPADAGPKPAQVELALLGGNLESNVTRGENGGCRLRHDFTVLHFASAPLRPVEGHLAAEILLPGATADAPSAIAVWVSPGPAQTPIQATGGWLQKR